MAVSFGAKVFSVLRVLARPRINLPLMATLALAGCPDHVKETAVDLGRACHNGETDKAVSATNALLRELECNGITVGRTGAASSSCAEAAPLTDAEIEALVRERPDLLGKIEGGKVCPAAPPPTPHFSICSLFNPAPNQNKAVASMRIGQTLSALELRGEALNLFASGTTLPAGSSLSVVFYIPGEAEVDANIVATVKSITPQGNIVLDIEIKDGATTGLRYIAVMLTRPVAAPQAQASAAAGAAPALPVQTETIEIGKLTNAFEVKPKGGCTGPDCPTHTPGGVDFGPPVI
jgi:hypothetical protein